MSLPAILAGCPHQQLCVYVPTTPAMSNEWLLASIWSGCWIDMLPLQAVLDVVKDSAAEFDAVALATAAHKIASFRKPAVYYRRIAQYAPFKELIRLIGTQSACSTNLLLLVRPQLYSPISHNCSSQASSILRYWPSLGDALTGLAGPRMLV